MAYTAIDDARNMMQGISEVRDVLKPAGSSVEYHRCFTRGPWTQ